MEGESKGDAKNGAVESVRESVEIVLQLRWSVEKNVGLATTNE